ncbi:MAG: hypothetical protein ACE5RG_10755 [Candidatus Nitrosomaritimum yanchengensis]
MSNKGKYIGVGVIVLVAIGILLFTNIYELATPTIEKSVDSAKDAVSKVEGKDVVSGAEKVSSTIQNETAKIEVRDPFE